VMQYEMGPSIEDATVFCFRDRLLVRMVGGQGNKRVFGSWTNMYGMGWILEDGMAQIR
jgi:hypothetical protein